ncbi:ABC transporter permease [Sphingomonas sp. LB-2]|uniref:ABC transporter permease n=1 Tax=Sphingomonas caeni TaxID=2984949 RepID=UPI0022320975|nr:ABC transporter permease [Sphingomonas caeni]MCW3845949.1 ABC transporter permease [Sphingomonas caeni]
MSGFRRGLRQAFTVARRDLKATVLTPTFLLFLLSPLFLIGLSVGAGMGARVATKSSEANQRIVVIAPPGRAAMLRAIDRQLRPIFRGDSAPPQLRIDTPRENVAAQAQATIENDADEVSAVLYGPLERPHILRTPTSFGEAVYLSQLAEEVLRAERAGGPAQLSEAEVTVVSHGQTTNSGRSAVALFAAFGVSLLTLMLSGQAVGAMAEERSNKVIEVLAAAIPLESVFFGKLLGAFGSALLFIVFWGGLLAALPKLAPPALATGFADMGAAVGPIFPLLFVAYFTMAYMLLSAVFLGIGALASSQRELQMLSLPVTVLQIAIMSFATIGAVDPNGWIAWVTAVFPLSSPHAMAARAAVEPELWPHALALVWQALWVGIVITVSARVFRRGVLKSGSPKTRFKKPRTIDMSVS